MNEPKTEFGAYVRAERKRKGMSQRELAKRANVAYTTIQRIETSDCCVMTKNTRKSILQALSDEKAVDIFEYRNEIHNLYIALKDLLQAMERGANDESDS